MRLFKAVCSCGKELSIIVRDREDETEADSLLIETFVAECRGHGRLEGHLVDWTVQTGVSP